MNLPSRDDKATRPRPNWCGSPTGVSTSSADGSKTKPSGIEAVSTTRCIGSASSCETLRARLQTIPALPAPRAPPLRRHQLEHPLTADPPTPRPPLNG